jgi:elongation factor Ts
MNIEKVRKLREMTGCGVVDARKALEETGDNLDRAAELVREWQRDRPSTKPTQAGAVFQYRHHDGCLGSMVVLACGTDFVARSPLLGELGAAVALQVAAMAPGNVEDLLEQPFVKDATKTIRQMVAEVAARTGETVQVREFCRCKV